MRNLTVWGLALALIATSCNIGEGEAVRIDKYFDLVNLLNEQAELLYSKGARIEKELVANGEKEQLTITPDAVDRLKEELKLFYDADINKPGLSDAYFTEQLPGLNGNRKVINTAKKAGPNVRLIEYDYQDDKLRQIRIVVEDKNDIYTFEKEMLLGFDLADGSEILNSFSITGKQDMVLKSELDFSLSGKLLFNP